MTKNTVTLLSFLLSAPDRVRHAIDWWPAAARDAACGPCGPKNLPRSHSRSQNLSSPHRLISRPPPCCARIPRDALIPAHSRAGGAGHGDCGFAPAKIPGFGFTTSVRVTDSRRRFLGHGQEPGGHTLFPWGRGAGGATPPRAHPSTANGPAPGAPRPAPPTHHEWCGPQATPDAWSCPTRPRLHRGLARQGSAAPFARIRSNRCARCIATGPGAPPCQTLHAIPPPR